MPRLKFVNLSFNILSTPLTDSIDRSIKWQQLKNLVLNSTYINWESVSEILDHLPHLEELHLSLNDYNNVCLINNNCQQLDNNCCLKHDEEENTNNGKCECRKDLSHKHSIIKILHFTGNPIVNWREVCKLGYAFPNLETLVLAECPIQSLDITNDADGDEMVMNNRNYERSESESESNGGKVSPHCSFRKLKFINLNATQLGTWDDIERLSKFPSLQCVRIQGCPLWESNEYTEHERRQLMIARLPNVETLNGGGKISAEEREDAERAFIRYYMDKPESDRPDRYNFIHIPGF